ncbi:DMT family transporter [Pseudoduganella sp.]|uniref:DMT family transporter n=1 Tax=Pseudoduganella sp. TaxID=1880898 RepID=UPI0035B11147
MAGYLYCALAMLTVGSTVVVSKNIGATLPPFTATALRFSMALPVFLVLCWLLRARMPRVGLRDTVLLVMQACAGSVGYTVLLISGTTLTSAATAGVLLGTLPIVSGAFAVLVLGERPTLRLLAAIGLAAIGVIVASGIAWPAAVAVPAAHLMSDGHAPAHAVNVQQVLGSALMLAAVACEAFFILLHKRLRAPIDALPLSTLMCAMGFLFAGVVALFAEQPWQLQIDAATWKAMAFYALVPTVLGFLLWYVGTSRVSGMEAALFTALAPVSATILASTILREPIMLHQLAGLACVLAAVASLTGARNSLA